METIDILWDLKEGQTLQLMFKKNGMLIVTRVDNELWVYGRPYGKDFHLPEPVYELRYGIDGECGYCEVKKRGRSFDYGTLLEAKIV